MKPITLRDWRADDLPFIYQLNQNSQPHLSGLTTEELNHLVRQARYLRLAECNGTSAGFLLAMMPDADYGSENLRWFKQRYHNFLYIDRVAIAKFAQGLGCGQALYADVESLCRAKKIEQIALEVNIKPLNQRSLDFHGKLGFIEVGTQDTCGGDKRVSLMMKQVSP